MANELNGRLGRKDCSRGKGLPFLLLKSAERAAALALLMGVIGCQSPQPSRQTPARPQFAELKDAGPAPQPEGLVLREGDVIKVAFPGAADLNTTATIRRDGIVTLPLVGQFKAAGLAPGEMEKEVLRRCGSELQVKEVSVAVVSSAFAIYVTGTVLRPGKVLSDRPLSALEAIMEAGGVEYGRANLKRVTLIRRENGRLERHILDLKKELKGQTTEPFMLKPLDILYVPERFAWF